MEEALIAEVAKYPWLYDAQHRSYKDMHKKKNTWHTIQQALCLPASDVKSTIAKWNYLRDGYVRRRRVVNASIPSGSGHDERLKRENAKKWPHYAAMDVLMVNVAQERSGQDSLTFESVEEHNLPETQCLDDHDYLRVDAASESDTVVEFLNDNQAFGTPSTSAAGCMRSLPTHQLPSSSRSMATPSRPPSTYSCADSPPSQREAPSKRRARSPNAPSAGLKEVIDIMRSRRTQRDEFDSFGEVVAGALRSKSELEGNAARVQIISILFGPSRHSEM